ncbi:hypothetical protein ACH5AL_19530 [Actinacidiphila glaucinigra]|uniref:hypothetical protein n=1 Tax=Actinacidiphila glaucinigra TaxID=235986 RepID=UPI0037B5927B
MRTFIADQEALTAIEFTELALGFDRELFVGVPGETPEERAAREAVAHEALNEMRERGEHDEVAAWDALYAEALMSTLPLLRTADRVHRAFRKGDAA